MRSSLLPRAVAAVLTAAGLVAAGVGPASAAGDTTAPSLVSFTLSPGTIDTSSAAATLTLTARITDDLAGISNGGGIPLTTATLIGPGGTQAARGYFSQAQRISGSPLDGTYRANVSVPRHAESGVWSVSFRVVDQAGNQRTYTALDLASAGLASSFTQTGPGDTVAPQVASFSLAPSSVDTSGAAVQLSFSARLTDDLAGLSAGTAVAPSQVTLRGPTGSHTVSAVFGAAQRTSGSSLDGQYAAQANLPRWSEQGTWTVASLDLYDGVGNVRSLTGAQLAALGWPTTFQQSGVGDIAAPQLRALTITPPSVDASVRSAPVTFRARITDDRSGAARGTADSASEVVFRSPTGDQEVLAQFGAGQQISGDELDGWYEYTATLPAGSDQGTWAVASARPVDQAHNAATLTAAELATSGFPTTFEVRSDGTPGAPTSVSAATGATAGSATVTWLAPSATGSSAISSYTVKSNPDGTSVTAAGAASSATVEGLADGVTYTFTVTAANGAGTGPASAPSNALLIGTVPDLSAPTLASLSVSPAAVQATTGPATVIVTLGVVDDASGPTDDAGALSGVTFATPSAGDGGTATFGPAQRIAGPATNGTYRATLALPQGAEVGAWAVNGVTLRDRAGNVRTYSAADLAAAGMAGGFEVRAAVAPDAPGSVSATAGDAAATVTWLAPVSDGGSAITGYTVSAAPGGRTIAAAAGTTRATVTGLTNGTAYTFTVTAANAIGTGAASSPSNPVTPGGGDRAAPVLAAFSLSPSSVRPGAGPVTVTARVTDAGEGIAGTGTLSQVRFATPSGTEAGSVTFGPGNRISGSAGDGTYSGALTVPADAATGTWPVVAVVLRDEGGNAVTLGPADLVAAGMPSGFTVATDAPSPPGPPSSVSATAGDASAIVSWEPPAHTGSSAIGSYAVASSPGGVSAFAAGGATSAAVAGLTNGTAYTFTVTAANDAGPGVPSTPSNPVTPVAPGGGDTDPPALVRLTISPVSLDPVSTTSVTITARITDETGVAVSSPLSSITLRDPRGATAGTYSLGPGRLASGDALNGVYSVRVPVAPGAATGRWSVASVVLRDAVGNAATISNASLAAAGHATGFTVAQPRVPGAPSGVAAEAGNASASVTWRAPSDPGSSAVVSYTVRSTVGGFSKVVAASRRSATVTGLRNGTRYQFTVVATNSVGSGPASARSNGVTPSGATGGSGSGGSGSGGSGSGGSGSGGAGSGAGGSGAGGSGTAALSDGYWFATAGGEVSAFGSATRVRVGAAAASTPKAPVVSMVATSTGGGYWLATSAGGVHAFGDARSYGSMGDAPLWQPIVGMAATPTGKGYWLVARDGGIFSFGDAEFHGSTGGIRLNSPIVGMTSSVTGRGYRFVAADGGIFSFGDARFYGSTGAMHLNQPVVGMAPTPTGRGYWMVARDGGIFSFGDARFYGSTGAIRLNQPIVGMAATATGSGYWFVAADGGVFAYGDARFFGSLGAHPPATPVVAVTARLHAT